MSTKKIIRLFSLLCIFLGACKSSSPLSHPTQTINHPPTQALKPTQTIPTAVPESEWVQIDEDWYVYQNHRLGFSIKIPANPIWSTGAQCSELNFPEAGLLPVTVVEGEDRIYITTETTLQFPYSERDKASKVKPARGENCEVVEVKLDLLENEDYHPMGLWKIVIKPITSENDLELLVDEYYGDCYFITEKIPLGDREIIKIEISGNEDLDVDPNATCVVRWGYLYYYSEEFSRAATWMVGQSLHFCSTGPNQNCYDNKMLQSFMFIPITYHPE